MATLKGGRTQALAEFETERREYGWRRWCYAYPLIPRLPYQHLFSFYWCAWLYVYITLVAIGIDLTKITRNWAYVPALRAAFIASPDWVRVEPGQEMPWDAIMFHNASGVWYHIGAIAHRGNGRILYTAEGDTSNPALPGSGSVGGVIATKTRSVADQRSYGHGFEIWHCTKMPMDINAGDLPTIKLAVDGVAGDLTFQRLAQILHASKTEYAIRYVQQQLNKAGFRGYDGKPLVVDGLGLYSNVSGDTPRTNTAYALQGALGITGPARDGVFSGGDSAAVRAWQLKLNAGHIF